MLRQTRMRIPRIALALPALALVAACGSQSPLSATRNAPTADSRVASAPAPAEFDSTVTEAGTTSGSAAVASPTHLQPQAQVKRATSNTQQAAVISQGQIALRTPDIGPTRFKLQEYLDGWNGTIASDNSDADKHGHAVRERIELRVPSARFSTAMDKLSTLGTLVNSSRTSKDVTTQVIDNRVRVRTQKLSLARIQALLAQAATINQVIAIESQLAQRQADLDSLEQQQTYLADQTSLATIDVYLTVPGKASLAPKKAGHGFFSGLHAGWRHLGASTRNVLAAVGTALPFAAVLAVVVLPFWLRRRRSLA
ncbi:MAG: hypothetical protein JWP74_293 [Marmoricola sp.]|nr:hypothetical protein [Marmoricola sp.]